jgi:hypothetical protein
MAAVKGVNSTKYDAGGQGDNAIAQGKINSRVEIWTDSYEASALASGSTIDIAHLPANAKVIRAEISFDALGSGSTLAVGDSNDPDRYITAASSAAVGNLVSNRVDGQGYVIGTNSGDSTVQILTAGASITGTIKSTVWFTR